MTLKEVFDRMDKEKQVKIKKFRYNYLLFSKKKIRYIDFKHKEKRINHYKLYHCKNCCLVFLDEVVSNSDKKDCLYCKKDSYQLNGQIITVVKPDIGKDVDVAVR